MPAPLKLRCTTSFSDVELPSWKYGGAKYNPSTVGVLNPPLLFGFGMLGSDIVSVRQLPPVYPTFKRHRSSGLPFGFDVTSVPTL
jgi:hypothetical protein